MLEALNSQADFCRTGCTTSRGARFWEDAGLLGEVARNDGQMRVYTDKQMRLAKIIAAAQFGGWSIERIKEMLDAYDVDPEVHDAIVTRLADQVRAAARLVQELPPTEALKAKPLEYDL